jgi:hypothetical protein
MNPCFRQEAEDSRPLGLAALARWDQSSAARPEFASSTASAIRILLCQYSWGEFLRNLDLPRHASPARGLLCYTLTRLISRGRGRSWIVRFFPPVYFVRQ